MATTSKAGDKPVKPPAKPKAAKEATSTSVAKKPAVRKPAVKKVAAPKSATAKKAVPIASKSSTATKASAGTKLAPEQRRFYVEVAAYYIAERRGFHGGSELDDWAQAEAEIDRLLREGILKP